MTGPEIVKEYGAVLVPIVIALVIGLAEPLRKLMDRHPVVKDVAANEVASQDVVTAVRLAVAEAREKDASAAKSVLDRMEARELHLSEQNEALVRQAIENTRLHSETMLQLGKDRDDDRLEIARLRDAMGYLREDLAEQKRAADACELRERALQDSIASIQRDNRAALRAMAARAYSVAKKAEGAAPDGPFTATNVFPDGKPNSGDLD